MQDQIDIAVLKVVVEKIDETLEKISESTNTISRLLAVHDDRIHYLEKDYEDTNKDIKDLYSKMENNTREILKEINQVETRIEDKLENASKQSSDQHQALSNKVDGLDTRLNELEKWKWYVVGAMAVSVVVFTNADTFINVLKLLVD